MSVYSSANPAAVRARPIAAAVGLPVARAEKTTLRVLSWEAPESSGSRRCDRRSAHAGQVPARGTRGGSITLALLAVPRRPPRPYRTTRPAVRVRPRLRPRRARRPPAADGPRGVMPHAFRFCDNASTAAQTQSCSRPVITAVPPPATTWWAVARPMPLLPPTTTTFGPRSSHT
jgi:hypothetical protein